MPVRLKHKLLIPLKDAFSETFSQRLQVGGIGFVGAVIVGYLGMVAFNFARHADWPQRLWHSL